MPVLPQGSCLVCRPGIIFNAGTTGRNRYPARILTNTLPQYGKLMLIVDAIVLTTVSLSSKMSVQPCTLSLYPDRYACNWLDCEGGLLKKGFLSSPLKPDEIAKRYLMIWVAGLPLIRGMASAVRDLILLTVLFRGMRWNKWKTSIRSIHSPLSPFLKPSRRRLYFR